MVLTYKSLYITNETKLAQKAKRDGKYVVLALPLLGESLDGADFPYALENIDEVTHDYLDKLILRFENKPWTILETKRCLVREITTADVDALYEIYAEKEVTAYMEDLYESREEEIAYTQDYIANHYRFYEFGMWIIEEKNTGRILGRAGLDMVAEKELPQLGFLIRKDMQKKSLATEVCNAILDYANKELGFPHLGATCHPKNVASIALLTKLGFMIEEKTKDALTWRL